MNWKWPAIIAAAAVVILLLAFTIGKSSLNQTIPAIEAGYTIQQDGKDVTENSRVLIIEGGDMIIVTKEG